jgi:cytochrome c556
MEGWHHLNDRELLEKIMGDLTKLNEAVAKLGTDVDTLLAATPASDQAAIDAATAAVTAVDDKVVAATPAPPAPAPA